MRDLPPRLRFARGLSVGSVLTVTIFLSGCSSSGSDSSSAVSDAPSVSGAASTSHSLVGLGDSLPGGLGCTDPCRSYVVAYGEAASKALGEPVTVTNLATNDGVGTGQLLDRVRGDQTYRDALAKADLITLTIGFNDWQGPCDLAAEPECLGSGLKSGLNAVESNLPQILEEVSQLRAGEPTAIRVTDYYNMINGNPTAPNDWGFDPTPKKIAAFETMFAKALDDFNATICRVAEAANATCVDLVSAFNGPTASEDAGPLLGSDHLHPSEAGHGLIADAIATAGYAPLR